MRTQTDGRRKRKAPKTAFNGCFFARHSSAREELPEGPFSLPEESNITSSDSFGYISCRERGDQGGGRKERKVALMRKSGNDRSEGEASSKMLERHGDNRPEGRTEGSRKNDTSQAHETSLLLHLTSKTETPWGVLSEGARDQTSEGSFRYPRPPSSRDLIISIRHGY